MSLIVYIVTYLSIIVFITAVVKRSLGYLNNPQHVRWEIYPVAHDAKRASYGGSYLEDVDWWKKDREKSLIGELKVMIPEIFFLKAVWENNRPLWYMTYPFHLGLYITVVFIFLLIIGAVGNLVTNDKMPLISFIMQITNIAGPVGFILVIIGALGLLYKRSTDPGLKNYSNPEHFFNLTLFCIAMVVALLAWRLTDPTFTLARSFIANLISFDLKPIDNKLFLIQILLAVLTIAYIPLTHMSHFFMKYFLYHHIRWGDEPNINTPEKDKKIGVVLNYPVSWSASHIAGHGKETWAEVATFNPVAKPEKEKE